MLNQAIYVGRGKIGKNQPVFIIAEAGVNHNGDLDLAKKLAIEAKKAGADCVKFQTFRAENLVTGQAPKAAYQLEHTDPAESQFAMLKNLELRRDDYVELVQVCHEIGIVFLSTAYNLADVDFLDELGVPAFKLASIHLTELPMIEYTARKNKPVFLSTGIGTLSDVTAAARAFVAAGNRDLIIFQCTTDYPARQEEANLRAMRTIADATGAITGYSDNSGVIDTCVYAVAAGAAAIEKHFTLNKHLPGPDHAASANPGEFAEMVKKIRMVEIALGSSDKKITVRESANATGMKRSLVAAQFIPRGTIITTKMLAFKRPATGLPPNALHEVKGKRAARDIPEDEVIVKDAILW